MSRKKLKKDELIALVNESQEMESEISDVDDVSENEITSSQKDDNESGKFLSHHHKKNDGGINRKKIV